MKKTEQTKAGLPAETDRPTYGQRSKKAIAEIGVKSLELIGVTAGRIIQKERRKMSRSLLEEQLRIEKARRNKAIGIAIAGVAVAAVVASLVPYKIEKEDPEEGGDTTKVKVRAISYAVDLAVAPDKSLDITLKAPGITKKSLINVEKHFDLTKADDDTVTGGDEIETEDETDLIIDALDGDDAPVEKTESEE